MQLILRDLGKSFDDRPVFSGINKTFERGDRAVVRGPNGSGKSTLLRLIAGILEPTHGEVTLMDGSQEVPARRRRNSIGYLSPDLVLYEELTVEENLRFFATVRELPHFDTGALTARVGLKHRAGDPYGTLSTGLKQRAKMAFALMTDPPVLLLDEPGSNLDDAGRGLVAEIIHSTAQRGMVILATNDDAEARHGVSTVEMV